MAANIKSYAALLYEICHGKAEKEAKEAIKNFIILLDKNNMTSKISSIIEDFEEIWNKREGILKANVTSAVELSKKDLADTEEYLKNKTKANTVIIENVVDKKIKGGLIIKYQDKVIDGSLLCELNNFQKELIN